MVPNSSQPLPPTSSRLVIDTILAGLPSPRIWGWSRAGVLVTRVNYSFSPRNIRPIDGVITFTESPLRQLSTPHDYALVLTLEVGKHLMKRILVDPGSVADLLYLPTLLRLGYKIDNLHNPRRVLVSFNGSQTSSLGEIVLPVTAGLVTALVPLTVIDESSSFNAILGRTWIHAMKVLSSSYHQMSSFQTSLGQIDIRGDQKRAKTCYEVKQ